MPHTRVIIGCDEKSASPDARMSIDIFSRDNRPDVKAAFVFHGRNGASDAPHMMKITEGYLQAGYVVFAPNLCNSQWNDSAGEGEDFLMVHHVRDCRRTVEWALSGNYETGWMAHNFALCGHSMGGYAAFFLAAQNYAASASHVLGVAPAISGETLIEARRKYHPDGIENLRIETPKAMEEWPRHNLFPLAANLSMPVSALVGADDNLTLPEDIGKFMQIPLRSQGVEVLNNEHHCLVGDNIPAVICRKVYSLEQASIKVRYAPGLRAGPSL